MRAVILLTAAGAALRLATLDAQSFWLDEAATVELVSRGLGDMLGEIPEAESTPPLYYVLAWLWAKAFGTGEVGLRSLSALLGSASIPVFYAAARELCSRRIGLAVAALAAVSPVLVWYSQEARAYALLVLLAALSLWSFALLLRRSGGRAAVAWGVVSALALASHYFAAFLVLGEAIWLLARPGTRRHALAAVGGVALTAVALLPLVIRQRSLDLTAFIADDSLGFRVARTGKNFLIGFDSPLEVALTGVAAVIAFIGVTLALARPDPDDRRGVVIATVAGASAAGIPLLLALAGADYLDTRNLLAAWLPLMVVVAAGLAARRSGRAGIAGVAVLCGLGLTSIVAMGAEPAWQRDDWRGIAEALGPAAGPRALVVQPANGRRPLALYLDGLRDMPSSGTSAGEVAVVYPVQRDTGGQHPSPPPRPQTRPLAGFTAVERRRTDSYALLLLRAERPRQLAVGELMALGLVPRQPTAVLIEP